MSTPTSSRTSRCTASSSVSPGSTKPAMHEYIGTGNVTPRARSASSPRLTSVMTAGARRGKARSPQRRALHGPLGGRPLRRRGAAAAEPMGAHPVHQLHGPPGDGPLDLGQAAVEGAQVAEHAVVGVGRVGRHVHRPARRRAQHPEEDRIAALDRGRLRHPHVAPATWNQSDPAMAGVSGGWTVGTNRSLTGIHRRGRSRRTLRRMTDVVIVEALRTPSGAAAAACPPCIRPSSWPPSRRRSSSAPASTRPRSARSWAAA